MSAFLYVGTPYTKFPTGREAAWKMACHVTAELIAVGIPALSPISGSHPVAEIGGLDPTDGELWERVNAPLMDAAGALLVFEAVGWRQSSGLSTEIATFKRAGKPIFHMKPSRPLLVPAEVFEWIRSTRG